MNKLQTWMSKATPAEKLRLAGHAGTTLATLRQIAGGYRTEGKLHCSAELAIRIWRASHAVARRGLPALKAGDFSKALRSLTTK